MSIGKIRRVKLTEVWKHEAHDFTTWLEDNTDALSNALDFTLSGVEREKSAGDFSVDLVGESENGGTVVIENQLRKSDHDHLGKVLTYLAALDAKAAVWIVAEARQEHIKAITWLNEATDTPFYLVLLEAIRIDESPPAPLFTKIVGPSVEARKAGETKQEFSERHEIRGRFWTLLLEEAKKKTNLHSSISPGTFNWVGTSKAGLGWNYAIRTHDAQVELYIDRQDPDTNLVILDKLSGKKEQVEASFGHPLEWQKLEGKRACRIRYRTDLGGWRDEKKWPEVVDVLVDSMMRLEKALKPHIKALKLGSEG